MPAAQLDASETARKLNGSILDHSGLAIERMPGLTFILELFCSNLPGALQPLIGEGVVATIEETKTTAVFDTMARYKGQPAALMRCEEIDAPLVIIIGSGAADFLIEAIFGGAQGDARPATQPLARPRTNIERRLLGEFAQSLGRALEAGFAQSAVAALAFESLQDVTDLNMLGRRDMPAVAARVQIATKTGICACTILLPQPLLQSLRLELSVQSPIGAGSIDPRWARQMEDGVSRALVPIIAIMEEFHMTLGDVALLRVGNVIPLRGDGMGQVRLECAGRGMFRGRLGQGEGRYCLEIEERIEVDEAPSPFVAAA